MSAILIPCWSCGTHMTLEERGDSDGNCPLCNVDIDMEELFIKAEESRIALAAELAGLEEELGNMANYDVAQTKIIHDLNAELATLKAGAGEVMPNAVRDALARRCLWLAFCWNDHNFYAAHVEARKEADKHGITDFEKANEWLTTPQPTPDVSGLVGALQHIMEMQLRGYITLGEKASGMATEALSKFEKGGDV